MKIKLIPIYLIIFTFIFYSCSNVSTNNSIGTNQSINISQKESRPGIDLFLLIDESGSMVGQKGTDNAGIRYDASKYLLQSIFVKTADKDYPNRVSIIQFSDNAHGTGLLDVLAGNLPRFQKGIMQPANPNGNTNILAALKEAKAEFEHAPKYYNRRDRAIVIFTDGKPERGNNEPLSVTKSYFNEIKKYVNKELKNFKIYVIGINNQAATVKFSETIKYWKEIIPAGNILPIKNINDLYSKFNYTIGKILEIKSSYKNLIKDNGYFSVNPYVDNLEFHIFALKQLKLSIYDPDNKLIKIDTSFANINQEGYIIYKIDNPVPGKWTYHLQRTPGAKQPVRIIINEIPFRLELLSPEPIFNSYGQIIYPLGKKVLLKAKFTKENGHEIKELPDYPLSFDARITSEDNPSFDKQIRFLKKNKAGINYYADKYIIFNKEGKYNIRLNVKGGTSVEFTQNEPVEIVKIPYFEIIKPKPLEKFSLGSPINIIVALKYGSEDVNPKNIFEDNPNNLILSQVISNPENFRSAAIWLDQSINNPSLFIGTVPQSAKKFNTDKKGNYVLAFDSKVTPILNYKLFPIKQVTSFDIIIVQSFWQSVFYYLKLIFFILLILFIFVVIIKSYLILYKGFNYRKPGESLIAYFEGAYGPGAPDEPNTNSKKELIGHSTTFNKKSRIVSVKTKIKNEKTKKVDAIVCKLWVKCKDKDAKYIKIYKDSYLKNLLPWTKSLCQISYGRAVSNYEGRKLHFERLRREDTIINESQEKPDEDSASSNILNL